MKKKINEKLSVTKFRISGFRNFKILRFFKEFYDFLALLIPIPSNYLLGNGGTLEI